MMYSRIQSPGFWIPQLKLAGFRIPQAKFAGLRNPNSLLWGEGGLKTQEIIASIFFHFSFLHINTCKLTFVETCPDTNWEDTNSYLILLAGIYCFLDPVSIKHGLRTADYGLRTEYKIRTRYKTRTGKHGLGIKHGQGIKGGLRTVDWV